MIVIDWTNAPEWANYVAMDGDERWWWHKAEPRFDGEEWMSAGPVARLEENAWETLAKRPSSPAELNTMDCQGGQ